MVNRHYIPIKHGFLYLTAIIDWYSRCIVGWEIDDTLDTRMVINALKKAFKVAKPLILNSDQGCQFASTEYIAFLKENHIRLSLFLLVTKRLYGKRWEWSIGQIKTCRKEQHVKIDDMKEMPDLICGKAAVDGNYNSTRDTLRTFTIGRKNWMTLNTVCGAQASAMIYSITETARANGLNVYYYVKHLLTELLEIIRIDGSVDKKELESLMPWSKDLPAECYSKRRK